MDPKTDFEEGDKATTRAYITLIRENPDVFDWVVHGRVAYYYFVEPADVDGIPDEDEINEGQVVYSAENNHQSDGRTTINISAINEGEKFEEVMDIAKDMGLEVIERTEEKKEDEEVGEYMSYSSVLYASDNIDRDWNVPHLLVYGSLSPEVEEACYAAFKGKCELVEVPNHYLVIGEELEKDDKVTLSDSFTNISMFDDDKEFARRQASMADYI